MWNPVLNFALLFETLIAAALVYIPFLQTVFGVRPINIVYWFIGVPFALAIFILGELRKLIIRRDPGETGGERGGVERRGEERRGEGRGGEG